MKTTGLEINPSAVAAARAQNLDVISADLSSYAATNRGNFDAVCAFQVLEHFSDPRAFLDAALLLLKPGGRLLVGVPNRKSFLRYIDNPLDLPPHHMLRWSAESFERLAGFFPLDVERIRFEPLSPYHIPGYLLALRNRLGRIGLLSRDWFLRPLLFILRKLLSLGLRRLCTGQTLYVGLRART
jgi:SAM-dependent methyltransferase